MASSNNVKDISFEDFCEKVIGKPLQDYQKQLIKQLTQTPKPPKPKSC